MLDWTILESPVNFPHYCIACMNGRGPVAATHRTMPGFGDVYLCERCAEKLSRLFGFAPGERMDALVDAAKRVSGLERELGVQTERVAVLEEGLAHAAKRIVELEDEQHLDRQRIAQLTGRIREEAEVSLSLVGDDAA